MFIGEDNDIGPRSSATSVNIGSGMTVTGSNTTDLLAIANNTQPSSIM